MNIDALRDYIASTVLPSMGIRKREFTITPPDSGGTRSSLFVIRAGGMPPLLMRAFGHRSQAVRNAEALRHLDALQLPAPRLVYYDLTFHRRLLPGQTGALPFITIETWIEGTRHADLDDPESTPAALSVARLLARYHAVTRRRWGRASGGRFRSFVAYTMLGVRRMAAGLRDRGWLLPEEERGMLDAFAAWQRPIAAIPSHNLVHNDANRHNFIVAQSGEVFPVDLHRLSYEPFPEELVNALYHFCRKDPDLAARFTLAYFNVAGEEARMLYDRTRGFFEPLNYLKKMYRRSTAASPPRDDPKMARWKGIVTRLGPPSRG